MQTRNFGLKSRDGHYELVDTFVVLGRGQSGNSKHDQPCWKVCGEGKPLGMIGHAKNVGVQGPGHPLDFVSRNSLYLCDLVSRVSARRQENIGPKKREAPEPGQGAPRLDAV